MTSNLTDTALGLAEVEALRAKIWANGFRPVAVHNAVIGTKTTGKNPQGKDWGDRARQEPPEAAAAAADSLCMNTGILGDGLRAIDIDIDDPAIAHEARWYVEEIFGETITRTRAGSRRCTLVYRAAEGAPRKRVVSGDLGKVEILGAGQQFVAYGQHWETGATLEWLNGSPADRRLESLPAVTEMQVGWLLQSLAELVGVEPPQVVPDSAPRVSGQRATADITDVIAALDVIPNDGPADWEAWNRILMAIYAATGGSDIGRAIAIAWSEKNPAFDQKATEERWKHYFRSPPTTIGAGTLFYAAAQARLGWIKPSEYADRTSGGTEFPALPPEPASPVAGSAGRIRLLSPSQCEISDGRKYLVKGLIAERDLVCIFGPPGAGKSIIAPHLAYSIAQGRPAFGRRVRAGGVFYVAAEDSHGMRQRVTGLKLTLGDAPGFALVEGVGSLLDDAQASDLRALVAEHRPAMIVIDTVAMAFPGIDENTSQDMGKVVAVARSLTEHGASVVLIHHDPKASDGTPRGHSLLNGALDVSLMLGKRDDNGIIRGKLVKNRNGACDADVAFRINPVSVGQDEDGDEITAPVCDEISGPAAPIEKLTRTEAAALAVLTELTGTIGMKTPDGRVVVAESDWREACDDCRISASDSAKNRADVMRRAFTGLLQRKRVQAGNNQVWLPIEASEFPPLAADFDGAIAAIVAIVAR